MGREVRKVPANWEHPKKTVIDYASRRSVERYKPMFDRSCEDAFSDWLDGYKAWADGSYETYGDKLYTKTYREFCEYEGGAPDPEYYRPDWDDSEMVWHQVYETVSEGTPVTPPFKTQDELIDYLVENGDFWDQKRREEGDSIMSCAPWSRGIAEHFIKGSEWLPSIIFEIETK